MEEAATFATVPTVTRATHLQCRFFDGKKAGPLRLPHPFNVLGLSGMREVDNAVNFLSIGGQFAWGPIHAMVHRLQMPFEDFLGFIEEEPCLQQMFGWVRTVAHDFEVEPIHSFESIDT